MFCGTEQDFDELGPEENDAISDRIPTRRRDDLAPGQKESELLTSIGNGKKGRFSDPLTISLIAISSVLLVSFLLLLFGRPILEKRRGSVEETASSQTTKPSVESTEVLPARPVMRFLDSQIQLSAGESFNLPDLAEVFSEASLIWKSERAEDIQVDQNGRVTAINPGSVSVVRVLDSDGIFLPQTIRVLCLSEEAEKLIDETERLNVQSEELAEIDTRTVSYFPAARNLNYFWDKTLFYALEDFPEEEDDGRINAYHVEKRKLKSAQSGNPIDYEIYRSPALGIVNKITSIEYLSGNKVEISEYYYENDGKLNFVFIHKDTSYTPSRPAAPNIYGDRYYFRDDVMVKWRTVNGADGVQDIAIGERERQNTASQYSVSLYSDQDDPTMNRFDSLEKEILNKAYITYETVLAEKRTIRISGCVKDASGMSVSDAKISLVCTDENNAELYQTFSNTDGMYRIIVPPGTHAYSLTVEKNDFAPVTVHDIDIIGIEADSFVESVVLVPMSEESYTIGILITDAVTKANVILDDGFSTEMLRIAGAEIRFCEGIGNRKGSVIQTVQTDLNGFAEVSLPPGAYSAEVSVNGYESTLFSVYAYPEPNLFRFSLSPVLGIAQMRIVLTWSDSPADLDAHLFTPFSDQDSGPDSHIWFRNRADEYGNRLDVDATDGYGPETVTIGSIGEGSYKYYVTDFSHCISAETDSEEMSRSDALVQIYTEDGLMYSFPVPAGTEGVIWEVFEIRNRTIIPIHRYYSGISDKPWWNTDKQD